MSGSESSKTVIRASLPSNPSKVSAYDGGASSSRPALSRPSLMWGDRSGGAPPAPEVPAYDIDTIIDAELAGEGLKNLSRTSSKEDVKSLAIVGRTNSKEDAATVAAAKASLAASQQPPPSPGGSMGSTPGTAAVAGAPAAAAAPAAVPNSARPSVAKLSFEGELEDDGDLGYEEFSIEGVKGVYIVNGPRRKLVHAMAARNIPDQNYISALLFTHHYFMSSRQLLDSLIQIYNEEPSASMAQPEREEFAKWKPAIHARVLNVFHRWVENMFQDFIAEDLLSPTLDFILLIGKANLTFSTKLVKTIYKKKVEFSMQIPDPQMRVIRGLVDEDTINLCEANQPPVPMDISRTLAARGLGIKKREVGDGAMMPFLKITPIEAAAQLTLIEQNLFYQIDPSELLDASWKKPTKDKDAPHIVTLIEWFNTIDLWVASEVVLAKNLKERRATLRNFVLIAAECWKLSNFNTMKEILSALERTSVARLANTWKALDKKDLELFERMKSLMSMENNSGNYRQAFKKSESPHLPYIGVHLQDLLSLEELPNRVKETGHINFKKLRKIWLAAEPVLVRYQFPYKFESTNSFSVRKFFTEDLVVLSEKEIHAQSKKIEP